MKQPTGRWSAASGLYRPIDSDWRTMLQAWLGSRGLLLLVGLVLALTTERTFVDLVGNWDAQHFFAIADRGYPPGTEDVAFFPGFPMVLAGGNLLGLPPAFTGVVVSTVCSLIAAMALVRLGGPWASVGWLFAPVAVFTVVPYTEALFCALAFWAWVWARRDNWWAAGVLAGAACTVRVSGLFLLGALAVMVLTRHGRGRGLGGRLRAWSRRGVWLLIPLAALFGYALFLYLQTGSWTAWYTAQADGWHRTMTWPWESALRTLESVVPGGYADQMGWGAVMRAEVVSMAVGLITVGWCLGRRLWAEAAWVAVQVLAFSTSVWWISVNRAVLLWFPTWMMLAALITWRPSNRVARGAHDVVVAVLLCLGVAAMLWWARLFFTGVWSS
ncbi:hypothetical protein [Enemella sp. A6]|uniref:hypothetical protein n=1 Tax=Enemella sp. A6 TaxID=3440152 RepID=UPI003EBE5981